MGVAWGWHWGGIRVPWGLHGGGIGVALGWHWGGIGVALGLNWGSPPPLSYRRHRKGGQENSSSFLLYEIQKNGPV